jgi:hypothetical protein
MLKGTPFEGGKNWPKITLSMRDEALGAKALAEAVQAVLLENLNMKTELEVLEPRVFRERLWKQDLQFVWIRWFMDYPDPHNEYFDTFYGKKPTGKRQAWTNEAFDKELEAGRDTRDAAKRMAHYAKAEEIMQTDAATWPGSPGGPRRSRMYEGWRRTSRARPWSMATSTSTCSRTCTWSRRRSVVRLQGGAPGSPGRPSSGKKRRTISRPPMTPSEQLRPELYAAFENRAPHIRPRARPAL